ncbi:MAG: hypothetical protein HQM15_08010 [Deltaproteobacteria bacterium]|nr:hypothetical protein [Deltaproteobacteria bacterium]
MTQTEKKRWGLFLFVWLLSGLLQLFFFRLLFFKAYSAPISFALFSTHLGSSLVYFILTEEKNKQRGRVWPIQFFFLSFFMPGISFIFLPFLWAQQLEGNFVMDDKAEIESLEFSKVFYEKVLSPQEKIFEALDIEPYADILAGQDIELKRGAIERMVELKNKESIQLLEKYRSDNSSELRFYVLSALHRIRQEFEEELAAAKKETQGNFYKISARIYLAKVYLQYVQSGLLDRSMQNSYLEEAAHHLRESLNSGHAQAHAFEVLLELFILQKNYASALQLLEEAYPKGWCKTDFYFQKKTELFYVSKDYLGLKQFVANFPLAQLQSTKSTQLYYGWGGEAYANT